MKRHTKHFFTFSIAFIMLLSMCLTAFASETVESTPLATGSTTFSNLDENPYQQYTGVDSNGNTYTVGIRPANNISRRDSNSWEVYFIGGIVNCNFYMDVTNNKCTDAYDESISIIGGTFDNDSLTHTSSYGKLTFDYTYVEGIAEARAWLKGTVTGSNNEVKTTWNI